MTPLDIEVSAPQPGAGKTAAPIRPKLHHVNLKTTRLDEMVAWYGLVLGAEVNFRFPGGAFTTNDPANHRIAFLAVPGLSDDPEKVAHAGLHHLAFEYDSFDDLMASYERLRDEGLTPEVCLDHGVTTSLYYADPDGNLVELQVDNFGDWSASTHWMRTSEGFQENPIGHFFDAEAVHRDYSAGTPFDRIRAGISADAYSPAEPPNLRLPAP